MRISPILSNVAYSAGGLAIIFGLGVLAEGPPPPCVRLEAPAGRDAIQAAIDSAVEGPGCLELAGRFDVARGPGIPSLVVHGPLRVTGPATLAMLATPRAGDWVLLQVEGSDVSISDVAFDGAARGLTEEQTHLLQVRGPAARVTVERASFNLPGPRGTGGDCVRLFGEVDRRVRGVVLRDLRAPACVRSAIGIQRGVHDVLVERLETGTVHGQAIDFEPTGGPAFACSPIVSGVVVRDSVLRRGVDRGVTLAIAGDGCALTDDVTIQDTAIEDGGVDVVDVGRVELAGLRIESARSPLDAAPALYAHRRVGALVVRDTTIVRLAGAKLHPAIQISRGERPDQRPVAAAFHRVTIEQPGPRAAIRVEGVGSLLVRDARLVYTGVGPGDWAVSGSAESVTLADVELVGPWMGAAPMPATILRLK